MLASSVAPSLANNLESGRRSTVVAERLSESLILAVYGEVAPGPREWAQYLEVLATLEGKQALLVISAGGGPDTLQRRDLEAVTQRHEGPVSVVTTSRVARGIVTALGWLGTNIKSFDPRSVDDAMRFLGLDDETCRAALARARELAAEMGVLDKLGI